MFRVRHVSRSVIASRATAWRSSHSRAGRQGAKGSRHSRGESIADRSRSGGLALGNDLVFHRFETPRSVIHKTKIECKTRGQHFDDPNVEEKPNPPPPVARIQPVSMHLDPNQPDQITCNGRTAPVLRSQIRFFDLNAAEEICLGRTDGHGGHGTQGNIPDKTRSITWQTPHHLFQWVHTIVRRPQDFIVLDDRLAMLGFAEFEFGLLILKPEHGTANWYYISTVFPTSMKEWDQWTQNFG
jgi:hypothetical protein